MTIMGSINPVVVYLTIALVAFIWLNISWSREAIDDDELAEDEAAFTRTDRLFLFAVRLFLTLSMAGVWPWLVLGRLWNVVRARRSPSLRRD